MPPLICSFSCLFGGTIPPFPLSPSYLNTQTQFQTSVHPNGRVFSPPFVGACMAVVLLLLFLLASPQRNPLQHPPSTALKMFSQNNTDVKKERKSKKLFLWGKNKIEQNTKQANKIWVQPHNPSWLNNLTFSVRKISHRCTQRETIFLWANTCSVQIISELVQMAWL